MNRKKRSRQKRNDQIIDIETARQERKEKRQQTAVKKEKPKKSAVSGRRATMKARQRLVITLIFVGILFIAGTSIYNIMNLKEQEAKVAAQKQELIKEKERLTAELSQIYSPDYIEQQARSQLQMIMPGEIIYIVEPSEKSNKESDQKDESSFVKTVTAPGIIPTRP